MFVNRQMNVFFMKYSKVSDPPTLRLGLRSVDGKEKKKTFVRTRLVFLRGGTNLSEINFGRTFGARHSTEVAFVLLNQLPQVRVPRRDFSLITAQFVDSKERLIPSNA